MANHSVSGSLMNIHQAQMRLPAPTKARITGPYPYQHIGEDNSVRGKSQDIGPFHSDVTQYLSMTIQSYYGELRDQHLCFDPVELSTFYIEQQ